MVRHSFGNDELPAILKSLQRLYGQSSLGEICTALLRLNNPMDRNQLVEVVLRDIKEVQMFLLAHPKSGQELADTNFISYAFINLNKTGGIYTKSIEHCNAKELSNSKTWDTFRQHMIAEFGKIVASGAGPTLGQEGYFGAYNITEAANEGDSLAKIIGHYAENVTAANSKVSDLEIRLSQLEIGGPPMMAPQQQQMAYYMPEAAYLTPAPDMMPVTPPKTVQFPQPPQQWTGQKTQQGYQTNKWQRKRGSGGN